MAMVELVDYNEIYNPNGKKAKKTTRRGRKKAETVRRCCRNRNTRNF